MCIQINYTILQPFAKNGTLLKFQKKFISFLIVKIIPKVLRTYNTVEDTILYYALYLQPSKKYGNIVSIKIFCFCHAVYF